MQVLCSVSSFRERIPAGNVNADSRSGINQEYDDRLEQEKNSVSYDVLEMSGSRAVWKDVLAVYSVKVNTDPDNPMEVATVDETKKQLLSDIFWEMNDILPERKRKPIPKSKKATTDTATSYRPKPQ